MHSHQVSVTAKVMHMSTSIALGIGLSLPIAYADSLQIVHQNRTPSSNGTHYWTPERLQQARPLPLPTPTVALTEIPVVPALAGTPVTSRGQGPTLRADPQDARRLFEPVTEETDGAKDDSSPDDIVPKNAGSAGAHFSSSRLIPLTADKQYPYRTVGKLFFTIPGQGDGVCSAAVIQRRLVLTAGQCVHRGFGGSAGFFDNFLFVPAYRNGVAPLRAWDWQRVTVTSIWSTGGGGVPNPADYAIIELQDQFVGGTLRRIGDVTGYLGWRTVSLHPNHVHMLAYPSNLDFGRQMHQVTAGSFRPVFPNNVEYGSDMRDGSSGGPWIQNFGIPAAGQIGGVSPLPNLVVGVISYGFTSTNPKVQGSSILNTTFVNLFNSVCADRFGNCD